MYRHIRRFYGGHFSGTVILCLISVECVIHDLSKRCFPRGLTALPLHFMINLEKLETFHKFFTLSQSEHLNYRNKRPEKLLNVLYYIHTVECGESLIK